jgi:hypothetical protein
MEEVFIDLDSPHNSIYLTACNPEFVRTVSLESEGKNINESLVFEEPFKNLQVNEKPDCFNYQGFDSDEQPLPNIILSKLQESATESKYFEDVKLEETSKDIFQLPVHEIEEKIENPKPLIEEVIEDPELEVKSKESIYIKSTKLVKSGMFGINNYYTYEIVSFMKNERFHVFRRFKDFEWLYQNLKDNYKGLSIPPLPGKTLKFLQDASEAEIRRLKLEKVLSILLKHSTLKKSQQLWIFLTATDSEFPKLRENMKKIGGKFKYHDLEDAIDQIVSKIQAKMNQIFNFRIIPFNKEMLEIQRYLKNIEIPSYSLSSNFSSYLTFQEKSLSLTQSMQFLHNPNFSKSMQMLKMSTLDQFRHLKQISQQLNIENLKIEALQGALDDYKNVIKRYSELEALIERKIKKSMNYFEDSEKYLAEIKVIERNLKDLEKETLNIENNIKKEKMWFQADRDEKFEQVLSEIFEAFLEKSLREKEFWLNLKHED